MREVTLPEPESDDTIQKRYRATCAESLSQKALSEEATDDNEGEWRKILDFWIREGRWPKRYFQACFDTDRLLVRKKSTPSLGRKRSNSASSVTPSDQRPREEKSAEYRDPRYKTLLATKGVYMDKSPTGIADASKNLCKSLLETEQDTPQNSLFRDDLFESTCSKIQDRNEVRVIRDISQLIVPPAEILATFGARELECLIESTNEGWNNSVSLTQTRPQPDYSVGFRREAFSDSQLAKLAPFIGNWLGGDQSVFMATYYMFFPFLAGEVKCGAAALDVADRQNAHSMAIAARAVFELFRLVGREAELDRQILSFSISHDHQAVRIYGYYPVMEGKETKYYRHPIHKFFFTALDGKEKWTAYQFTKNVYDIWMPSHFARIRAAIDQIPPDIDFTVDPLPETGLSQGIESLSAATTSQSPTAPTEPHLVTPQSSRQGAAAKKRPRKKA